MQLSNAYLIKFIKQPIWKRLSYEIYDWLSILWLVRKNMSSTVPGVTVISVQDASNASPVNLSSAIVDLKHVLRRPSIQNVRSANAVVTGKVVRSQNLKAVKYNVM